MERREGFVRKGFLATLAQGVCTVLVVALVCVTALGGYLVHEASNRFDGVFQAGTGLVASLPTTLPQIRQNLPPALADAISDERAPQYRPQIEIESQLITTDAKRGRVVVAVSNTGDQTVTLLAARVTVLNATGVPTSEISTYLATPLMIEDEWRGPLLPGTTRHVVVPVWGNVTGASAEVEIADLRLWRPSPLQAEAAASLVKSDPSPRFDLPEAQ